MILKITEPRLLPQTSGNSVEYPKQLGPRQLEHRRLRRNGRLRRLVGWCEFLPVCLFAVTLIMPPHLAAIAAADSTESETPVEEDEEANESELIVSSPRGRRSVDRKDDAKYRILATARCRKAASYSRPISAIVGHQLANHVAAPRLI
jgi:hypothetical protein